MPLPAKSLPKWLIPAAGGGIAILVLLAVFAIIFVTSNANKQKAAEEAEIARIDAEKKAQDAIKKMREAEAKLQEAENASLEAEKKAKEAVDLNLFKPINRISKQIASEWNTGMSINDFKALIKQFSTELSIADDEISTEREKEVWKLYDESLTSLKDAATLWDARNVAKIEAQVGASDKFITAGLSLGFESMEYQIYRAYIYTCEKGIPVIVPAFNDALKVTTSANYAPLVERYSLKTGNESFPLRYAEGFLSKLPDEQKDLVTEKLKAHCIYIQYDAFGVPLQQAISTSERAYKLAQGEKE